MSEHGAPRLLSGSWCRKCLQNTMVHSWRICSYSNRNSLAGIIDGMGHALGQLSWSPSECSSQGTKAERDIGNGLGGWRVRLGTQCPGFVTPLRLGEILGYNSTTKYYQYSSTLLYMAPFYLNHADSNNSLISSRCPGFILIMVDLMESKYVILSPYERSGTLLNCSREHDGKDDFKRLPGLCPVLVGGYSPENSN